jgi:hypothetical protein
MNRAGVRTLLFLLGLTLAVPAISFAAPVLYWLDTNYGAPKLSQSDLNGAP